MAAQRDEQGARAVNNGLTTWNERDTLAKSREQGIDGKEIEKRKETIH
jgi:hypothetical protein